MTERKVLDRSAILQDLKLRRQEIKIGELGTLIIQELSGTEAALFQKWSMANVDAQTRQIKDASELARASAQLIVWAAIDEAGNKLFSKEDIPAIMGLGSSLLEDVAGAILDLSGLDKGAKAAAKKNLAKIQTPDSGTS